MGNEDPDSQGGIRFPTLMHSLAKGMLAQKVKLAGRDLMEDEILTPVNVVVDGRVEMTGRTSIHPLGSFVEEVFHIFLEG